MIIASDKNLSRHIDPCLLRGTYLALIDSFRGFFGGPTPPRGMTGKTLVSVLQGSPSSPAIVVGSGGPTLTRGQLLALAEQFAQSLRASGILPGDVVTIVDANTVRRVGGQAQERACQQILVPCSHSTRSRTERT